MLKSLIAKKGSPVGRLFLHSKTTRTVIVRYNDARPNVPIHRALSTTTTTNNNNNNNNNNGSTTHNNNAVVSDMKGTESGKKNNKLPNSPETTKEEGAGIPMPDRDMELKLANIQSTISDYYKQGDFSKALKMSQDLLNQTQAHFGQDHPATASAFNNIGLMQKLLGDFIEARRHYTAAMRIYGKVVGRDHASYAMTLHNLGNLNKAQVHFDTSLKATERLSLVETALEYFEEAWAIRKAELGDDHPLTIATRSSYGSTLAAQVLHQHRHVQPQGTAGRSKPKYVSLNSAAVTQQGWNEAEKHLRQAMEASIANPRGKSVNNNKGTKNKSKNAKQKQSKQVGTDPSKGEIQTLSAAAAAQNLAVFLKSRAMTEDPYDQDLLQEAYSLYTQVQRVRRQLLPSTNHPDLLATKYSLAELLEVMGDEETANTIRQEILDDYEPLVVQGEQEQGGEEVVRRQVLVERTVAPSSKDTNSK